MGCPKDLLDTIRRLLALGNSPNEYEAQQAMAKAAHLMAKHNIAMAEVDRLEAPESDWVTETALETSRIPYELRLIHGLLQEYFFIRVTLQRCGGITEIHFFGELSNVEIARYAYGFLQGTFSRLASQRMIARAERRLYYHGLADGFAEKLEAQRKQLQSQQQNASSALMVIEDRLEKALIRHHGNLKTARKLPAATGSIETYQQGREDGKQIVLNPALKAPARQRRLPEQGAAHAL